MIFIMKALLQAIKNHKTLVFFDLEATQFSHEMTEIAAIKATLKDDGSIKKAFKPLHYYVKPKGHVGARVSEMTGLTDQFLEKEGVPFRVVQKGLQKYVGRDYKKALYICYGNQDGEIFEHSAANNMDSSMEEALFVKHHCFDFMRFLSRFVTGDDGNPINLTKAMDVFELQLKGKAHTATSDTYSLMALYDALFTKKEILAKEYGKTIARGRNLPEPFRILMNKLRNGETIDMTTFDKIVLESLK